MPEDGVNGDRRQGEVGAAVGQRAAQVAPCRFQTHREQLQRAQPGRPAGVRPAVNQAEASLQHK